MLKIYVCGPTVYNFVHIGNLRPILTYDLMLKAARKLGIEFKFIHNITDIDDKIINQALKEGASEKVVASKYANDYLDLLKKFNVDTISNIEYVTENLGEIDALINQMKQKGDAYQINGNVWFNVQKNVANYGLVSGQKLENMNYEDQEFEKQNAADFALWKETNVGIKYDSSLGFGRPGWHTECVAMIHKHFGDEGLDLHGGGMDLTFPHHENENIQYFSVTGKPITKKWLRTGQINLNNEKMSKSLNNVFLARDFIAKYSTDHLRMAFLLNSITSIINFDENLLNNINLLFKKIKKIYFFSSLSNDNKNQYNESEFKSFMTEIYELRFSNFNKKLNELIKEVNVSKNPSSINLLINILDSLGFNFKQFDYDKFVPIYHEWQDLLKGKNYQEADKLRTILLENDLV
ncbi:class I tRNA ligase family protein [Mycoplasmopsis edwardii]|uniref:Class I tRNA ligase family protein n=1 Tax=Mycoplasmopsis edwardii TaxID=53558 RepID=A0ACD4PHQ2_9BACT|nr:class I tRNA ligase family protein [Mycoplasmopsis edwardii]WBP84165.1 class I tRNA ligase family protein [Mycoplasmopsis edwardii]